jgi:tripartite-type tricarboxylate transporter receptor subunit TctC
VNAAVAESLRAPRVREMLLTSGADAAPSSPEELTRFLQSEMTKWGKVVRAAGVKGD